MNLPLTLAGLKEACRSTVKELLDSIEDDCITTESEGIYKKLGGDEVITESDIGAISAACYYYHPKVSYYYTISECDWMLELA